MYEQAVDYICLIWNKCKNREQVSKEEINKAIDIFYKNIDDVTFKQEFDARFGVPAHRLVISDLNNYMNGRPI